MVESLGGKNIANELNDIFIYVEKELCETFATNKIDIDLFVLATLSTTNTALISMKFARIDTQKLEMNIREHCQNKYVSSGYNRPKKKIFTQELQDSIERSEKVRAQYKDEKTICAHHLLISILLENPHSRTATILRENGINEESIVDLFISRKHQGLEDEDFEDPKNKDIVEKVQNTKIKDLAPKKSLKVLNKFCENLTEKFKDPKNQPKIIGRDGELNIITNVLSRKNKNNVVLCGESGVGRTSIIYKLVNLINSGNVPEKLVDKRILRLNITSVVAGTKYRGDFEERMINIIEELKANKDIILFIGDLHTIMSAGSISGSLDAAQILKPALQNGEVQIIATTTLDDYKKNVENDNALNRRFQKLYVSEVKEEECVDILTEIKKEFEDHHNVKYSKEIIKHCVKLSKRYISDKLLPDSAIDILDTCGASLCEMATPDEKLKNLQTELSEQQKIKEQLIRDSEFNQIEMVNEEIDSILDKINFRREEIKNQKKENKKVITEEHINDIISQLSGIPIQKLSETEGENLLKLEDRLNNVVIGQEQAIKKISESVIRGRIGLKKNKGTIANIFLIGGSGVGKTLVVKQLAKEIFGSEQNMIRIDMSEYMEAHSVSKLLGSPPGYTNSDEGGQLTEKIKAKPYSIILFDEIEKAHPSVYNILLQLFDEGHITDSKGHVVDCKNTINILTSNVGTKKASELGRPIGFGSTPEDDNKKQDGILEKSLKNQFAPEFLNRIDDIIYFNNLTEDNLKKIIDLELKNYGKILLDTNFKVKLKYGTDLIEFIFDKIKDEKQMGARPINRAIQTHLSTEISRMLIENKFVNNMIKIKIENNNLIFE